MSGHSKWSTIKHQKAAADQKRGQAFSKLGKAITIAARDGSDPNSNFKLRLTIEKAREVNMPKENINRAITRGSDGAGEGERLESVTYEGYGPVNIAVIVEAVTDNRNRTTAEIKNLFERSGGSLAGPGSVAFNFKKIGLIIIEKPADPEQAMLKIIDLGIENVEEDDEILEVYTKPDELEEMAQKLAKAGYVIKEKDLSMQPMNLVTVTDQDKKEKVLKFMDALEDHDDVQKTFANFDFPA